MPGHQNSDTDSDGDDDSQMRQFMEAADHTLLTNAMFQNQKPISDTSTLPVPALTNAAVEEQPKSERYLDEEDQNAGFSSNMQISEQMQKHIWRKLSAIIENQIEFYETNIRDPHQEETPNINQVQLVANANCYIQDDIVPEVIQQKRPKIKRRQVEDEPTSKAESLASIVVCGETILKGQDMQHWAQRKPRKDKLFEYKTCNAQDCKLQAIDPTNEFTAQRHKNKWNESKISQKKKKC
ncbi:CG32554 [Drosophila busckii]|uniref:CG32554 n=1 Tax=Drosophila busckii TaxID=30019 RepID=A0A0M4F9Q4_DROBS|nr:uncharacterized protein LOC108605124 [Drosophila busckii]ALC49325.1 CG32554 [Drosophila busckii]